MKLFRFSITVVLSVLSLLSVACIKEPISKSTIHRLQVIESFPDEETVTEVDFLGTPVSAMLLGGNIYVADNKRNQIIIYSLTGQFLGTIGREGDGPGEFREFNRISEDLMGTGFWVLSHAGSRMQHIDAAGGYIEGFNTPYSTGSFAVVSDSILVIPCTPNDHHGSIVALSYRGDVLWDASPRLLIDGEAGFVPQTSRSTIASFNGHIWQYFLSFNVVRIFSPDGTLKREFTLKDDLIDPTDAISREGHRQWISGAVRRNGVRAGPTRLFGEVRTYFGYCWLTLFARQPQELSGTYILQIDPTGTVIAKYKSIDIVLLRDIMLTGTTPILQGVMLTSPTREEPPSLRLFREVKGRDKEDLTRR